MRPAALALCAILLAGCSQPAAAGWCTQVGAVTGIAVRVEPDLAVELRDLELTVCLADRCTDYPVKLDPGTTTVPDPCPSAGDPDSVCSATASPDGTEVGFVAIAQLPAGPLRVSATGRLGDHALTLAATQVQVRPTYPNGPSCPPEGNQASVTLSTAGIR